MRITLMVGEHIAPIQFALRLRIPRGSRLRVRPCRDTPDIIPAKLTACGKSPGRLKPAPLGASNC
jgi:hypothetical protein